MRDTLVVILAGGRGERLEPLTRDRAKPAVPFRRSLPHHRLYALQLPEQRLSPDVASDSVKSMSLDRHINLGWRRFICSELGEFIDVVPPQQRNLLPLVPGHRRRGVSEHLHDGEGASRSPL